MQPLEHTSQRSQLMQQLYPENLMMEAFGTVNPSREQRTAYFFKKWREWKNNSVSLKELGIHIHSVPDLMHVCNDMGLKQFWHYQVRGHTVRFCDMQSLGFFKIAISRKSEG